MQVLYMHWQTEKENQAPQLLSSFDRNIDKMYKLYLYYLSFLHELWHFGPAFDRSHRDTGLTGQKASDLQLKLNQNPILSKLFSHPSFEKELSKNTVAWNKDNDEELIKRIFNDLKASDRYEDYVQFFDQPGQHADIILHIIKHYSENFAQFEQHVEEEFPTLSDDYNLVFTMLKKTLRNVEERDEDFFVTLVQDVENTIDFGHELIERVVKNDGDIQPHITSRITKWEPGQIAVTDAVILKMGIAEFLYFPSIPHTVTINEYVEVAKQYSPPKSKNFVNGLLDSVSKDLSKKTAD